MTMLDDSELKNCYMAKNYWPAGPKHEDCSRCDRHFADNILWDADKNRHLFICDVCLPEIPPILGMDAEHLFYGAGCQCHLE